MATPDDALTQRIGRTLRERPLRAGAFLAAALIAVVFLARAVLDLMFWAPPEPHAIEPWMTVRYVARMHRLDPRDIARLAELDPPGQGDRPGSIREYARRHDIPAEEVIAAIRAAIAELEDAPPPPESR